jgi:hypothetical protein
MSPLPRPRRTVRASDETQGSSKLSPQFAGSDCARTAGALAPMVRRMRPFAESKTRLSLGP